jgi:hypothetical protein
MFSRNLFLQESALKTEQLRFFKSLVTRNLTTWCHKQQHHNKGSSLWNFQNPGTVFNAFKLLTISQIRIKSHFQFHQVSLSRRKCIMKAGVLWSLRSSILLRYFVLDIVTVQVEMRRTGNPDEVFRTYFSSFIRMLRNHTCDPSDYFVTYLPSYP